MPPPNNKNMEKRIEEAAEVIFDKAKSSFILVEDGSEDGSMLVSVRGAGWVISKMLIEAMEKDSVIKEMVEKVGLLSVAGVDSCGRGEIDLKKVTEAIEELQEAQDNAKEEMDKK